MFCVFVGINCDENLMTVRSSESSADGVMKKDSLQEVDDTLATDSGSSNTDSLTAELENDLTSSTVDLSSESSSESNDSKTGELDMSFTVTDNANTCLDDVTNETDQVTADGPSANAIDTVSIELANSVSDEDHRHLVVSDLSCGNLTHDPPLPQSVLVSHVAMDIN